MPEDPLDHRHADDGQHLFRRGEGQGPQPRPLAADEDDRLHYFVVVVVDGGLVVEVEVADFVVVVVPAVVLVVVATVELVVDETAAVVGVTGTVVVVVATGWLPDEDLEKGQDGRARRLGQLRPRTARSRR